MPNRNWHPSIAHVQPAKPPKQLWRPPAPARRPPYRTVGKIGGRPVTTLCNRVFDYPTTPLRGWEEWVLDQAPDRWMTLAITLLKYLKPPQPAPNGQLFWFVYYASEPIDRNREIGGFQLKVHSTPRRSSMTVYEGDELVLSLEMLWRHGKYVFRALTYDAPRATATAVCLTLAVA